MADLFTKIGENIKITVKEAAEQTQKSVDQTVYRKELLDKKSELKKVYVQLGMAKYEAYISETEDADHTLLYTKITSLQKEIYTIENKIQDVVNSQKDSFDTYKREVKTTWNEAMAKEPRPEKGADGVEIMKICEQCNTGNHADASFCINCGHNF